MADMKLAEKTKALPWLKRLLDDDDSSDAASQLSDASPKRETHSVTKEGEAIAKKRRRGSDSSDEESSEIPKAPRKSSEEKRRQVRRGSSSGKGTTKIRCVLSESSDSDDTREKQPRRLKKSPKAVNSVRHKHSHSHSVGSSRSAKNERSLNSKTTKKPADEAKSNAASFREQRKRKLHALRVSTGEHDRIAAFRLKRMQSREALKIKERKRMRALRAARDVHKISTGADADVEDEGASRPRSSRLKSASSDTRVKLAATRKVRKTADPERKVKEAALADAVKMATGSTEAEAERQGTQVESPAGTKHKAVEAVKQEGGGQISVTSPTVSSDSSPEPVKLEHDRERSAETTKDTSTESARSERALNESSSGPEKSQEIDSEGASNVKVELAAAVNSGSTQPTKSEPDDKEQHADGPDGIKLEGSEDKHAAREKKQVDRKDEHPVKVEPDDNEPRVAVEGTFELGKNEVIEEKQAQVAIDEVKVETGDGGKTSEGNNDKGPPASSDYTSEGGKNDCTEEKQVVEAQATTLQVKVEGGDVKKISEETDQELLLDMMPIPRKMKGEPTATSSATAFVIPKRTFAITGIAGTKEISQVGRAGDRTGVGRVRRPLDLPVRVTLPPLPSPESSPNSAKQEPVRPQKKRTKNFVPVKNAVISAQDRALMRLSRKRNSIFMAAAELAAQVPDLRSHKKLTTRMLGYEVFDADEQTLLPDLIRRLSCATKREMGSNQETYPASFFGVSLSTPKAKGETAGPDDCGGSEQNARKICCYEELRFERPADREFYQQKMYGTTFAPQMLRGWITLIIRNARFERKSTGFRFNQGRDREEFAASLSKRYTINKSVPRCDIPRENWQKLMRNQPGNVYLHYYNREDAEQASRVFRDDLGHPLQLKIDYKAGVVMTRSPSPGIGPQRNPRGSYSSDGGAPEPSPVSSQNESAHSTPSWRRERQPASKNDLRYSRYDRGAPTPPVHWPKVEGRYVSGNKRPLLERRSRSRSRSKSFHSQQHDPAGHDNRGGSNIRERPGGGDESASTAFHSDAEAPAWKRARVLAHSPRRSRSSGQDINTIGEKSGRAEGRQEGGQIKSNTGVAPANPARASNGGDRRKAERSRSPLRRWKHEPNNPNARRDSLSGYPRDRSRGPVPDQQQPGKRRSSSRSPPRALPNRGGRSDFNGGRHTKERRGSREFGRGDAFANSARGRRMQSDRGRGGFNGRRGGGNARP